MSFQKNPGNIRVSKGNIVLKDNDITALCFVHICLVMIPNKEKVCIPHKSASS